MTLTPNQRNYINRNLQAFIHNFGSIRIEKVPYAGFDIYFPADSSSFMMYCENIYTLDGWLYGCVQAAVRKELKTAFFEMHKEEN